MAADPHEQYLHAVAELKRLAREEDAREVKEALKQIKEEFPDHAGPDLESFIYGELQYWKGHYTKALMRFEKILRKIDRMPGPKTLYDYRESEFGVPALEREFEMAQEYLHGRKKRVLGFLKFTGYAEGVEIMEKISDRAGLDEPNGIGLRAAVAVAEHYEARERYLEAYDKWTEIATYWAPGPMGGPIGKKALYRRAEDYLAAYNQPPREKRPHYDASKLETARTHYRNFLALYPQEARQSKVPDKIKEIDEQLAYKQFTIGQFYRRTGEPQAANLYFDMVVRNWPQTEAAGMAKQALQQSDGR